MLLDCPDLAGRKIQGIGVGVRDESITLINRDRLFYITEL